MKKILYLFMISLLFSCEGFVEDYDVSPNSPTEVTSPLLLTATEVATGVMYSGQLARTANIMTQHIEGTDFQLNDIANYVFLEATFNNEWNAIYEDALINAQTLIDRSGDNPYYRGIGNTLKALNLGLATDLWGDVPNSQALKGLTEGNFSPAYDSQEQVIADIQAMLSSAIDDFGQAAEDNALVPLGDDLFFGGDVTKWTKAAWMLKARYANRLSKRDATGSATQALQFLDNAGLTGNEDDLNSVYGSAGNEQNQWGAFQSSRAGYIKMGSTLVDMMTADADPRLSAYAATNTEGNYVGAAPGSVLADGDFSDIGTFYGSTSSNAPLMTYVEAKFIEAEAALRSGDDARAAAAHNAAVAASLDLVTGDSAAHPDFVADKGSEDAGSITMEKIMTQKYVAMFTQVEAYNDWRRTGIPSLDPNPNGTVSSIPQRLPTAGDERLYNVNATVVSDVTQKVWWAE